MFFYNKKLKFEVLDDSIEFWYVLHTHTHIHTHAHTRTHVGMSDTPLTPAQDASLLAESIEDVWDKCFELVEAGSLLAPHDVQRLAAAGLIDDEDDIGWTLLMAAANQGQVATVRLLLQHGADPNAGLSTVGCTFGDDETALHLGVRSGNLNVVKALVNAGAKLADRTSHGFSPRGIAAYNNAAAIAAFLGDDEVMEDEKEE